MNCSCCGESKDGLTAFGCHPEVSVCRGCAIHLATTAGATPAFPIFPATEMSASVAFYEAAGFEVEVFDERYGIVARDGLEVLHLAGRDSVLKPGASACLIFTTATDRLHAEWTAAGLPVSDLTDRPWGLREFTINDPSGNVLRVGRGSDDDQSE